MMRFLRIKWGVFRFDFSPISNTEANKNYQTIQLTKIQTIFL